MCKFKKTLEKFSQKGLTIKKTLDIMGAIKKTLDESENTHPPQY
jgi:hypothetical protein